MLPEIYFDIIGCPRCAGAFDQTTAEEIVCRACSARYPVVEDIPVLIVDSDDAVSRIAQDFYATQWKRDADNRLQAKVVHEDLSDRGQRYIQTNEARFFSSTQNLGRKRIFLDAGCGAQPRVTFGADYDYHVCLDFSLDGLYEARQQIGERCVPIIGSLLKMPLRDEIADAALASHCIYHIDADKQPEALCELQRVLVPGAPLLVFYANPDSLENRVIGALRGLKRRTPRPSAAAQLYFNPLSIAVMQQHFQRYFGEGLVHVAPLRFVSVTISRPVFRLPLLGSLHYALWTWFERSFPKSAGASLCTYVSYTGRKQNS